MPFVPITSEARQRRLDTPASLSGLHIPIEIPKIDNWSPTMFVGKVRQMKSQELAAQVLRVRAEVVTVQTKQAETSPLWALYADWERDLQSALLANWDVQASEMQEYLIAAQLDEIARNGERLAKDTSQWALWTAATAAALIPFMESGATIGSDLAIESMFTDYALGLDASTVNVEVAAWARKYAGQLAKGLSRTERRALRENLASWVESHEDYPALVKRLSSLFGRQRADLIASTEATSAYANGNYIVWKESGIVVGRVWNTARDEWVCKEICRPLHGQIAALDSNVWHNRDGSVGFGAGPPMEPAHPR
jgi:hypothetical protein